MVQVLYADKDILVAVKPAGVESQAAKRFAPDMVSEIRKYLVIHKLCTPGKEPYVGVIHRLDKPVSGVMVYALSKNAAAALSRQVQDRRRSMGLLYVESRKKMWISLWIIWKNPWMEMNPMLWIMVENVENGLNCPMRLWKAWRTGETGS